MPVLIFTVGLNGEEIFIYALVVENTQKKVSGLIVFVRLQLLNNKLKNTSILWLIYLYKRGWRRDSKGWWQKFYQNQPRDYWQHPLCRERTKNGISLKCAIKMARYHNVDDKYIFCS